MSTLNPTPGIFQAEHGSSPRFVVSAAMNFMSTAASVFEGGGSVQKRVAALRARDAAHWQRLEETALSDEDLAVLEVAPPREMFEEDWSHP